MKPTRVTACVFAVAASLAGCGATSEVEYSGTVRVTSPELILIGPGVQVIADADEPLFYSKGYYWLYRDGYWFRSDLYRGGFARVDFVLVPGELRLIDRPQLYVQYRRHLGRDRFARPPRQQTRTQPTYPSQPYPNQPEVTPPPSPTSPPVTPNDSRREPYPQRTAPPDIDRTAPPAPGHEKLPPNHTDRSDQSNRDHSSNADQAPGQSQRPEDRGPDADKEKDNPSDRATPPNQKPDKTKKKK